VTSVTGGLTLETASSLSDIGHAAWSRCHAASQGDPFTSFEFLDALERSGSVGGKTGWRPLHAVLRDEADIVAVAPVYVKAHSYGEYVFDHNWADAYQRAGGAYYPKLLCGVPFTPVPGPRLLALTSAARKPLAAGLCALARHLGVSSVHVNFSDETDAAALSITEFMRRDGVQYHWRNRGYESFADFLAALSSRKRKAINRERKEAAASGLTFRRLSGGDILEPAWDALWTFYQDTGARKWGRPYLTRSFFSLIGETMADRILLVLAERDGIPVAGALNFIGADALYGRYWGAVEHTPFLHFEVCYHQAIEFAIERGLSRVEAGAQGEHKIARGYLPIVTQSFHWIGDPAFRRAIERYLSDESAAVAEEIRSLEQLSPFRADSS
jgi:hypothetical protein